MLLKRLKDQGFPTKELHRFSCYCSFSKFFIHSRHRKASYCWTNC